MLFLDVVWVGKCRPSILCQVGDAVHQLQAVLKSAAPHFWPGLVVAGPQLWAALRSAGPHSMLG